MLPLTNLITTDLHLCDKIKCNGEVALMYYAQTTHSRVKAGMMIRHFHHGSGSGSALNKNPDPTLNRNEERNIYIF